jgi:hypothetical protein
VSNRRKGQPEKPATPSGMTIAPSIFANQYEYRLDNGMAIMNFGRQGETHASVTMSASLAYDMATKLVAQLMPVQPPNAEEPKSEG